LRLFSQDLRNLRSDWAANNLPYRLGAEGRIEFIF
jgi:hypothetical protein